MSQPNLATDPKDLSDRTVFVLNQTQWDTFVALLNAQPRPIPTLERLLKAPDRFSGGGEVSVASNPGYSMFPYLPARRCGEP